MSDLFSLDGKHVLVTGGSSGLGRFFAVFLAARGAQVTVAARRAEALAKTVDDIGAALGLARDDAPLAVPLLSRARALRTPAWRRYSALRLSLWGRSGRRAERRFSMPEDRRSWCCSV